MERNWLRINNNNILQTIREMPNPWNIVSNKRKVQFYTNKVENRVYEAYPQLTPGWITHVNMHPLPATTNS